MRFQLFLASALLGTSAQPSPLHAQPGGPAQKTPVLKMYAVQGGNADAIARMLQEVYAKSSNVKVITAGSSQIIVWGNAEDQLQIALAFQALLPPPVIEVIPLATLKAVRVGETLKALFGSKGPFLEADAERNALIVRGTREQITDLKLALRSLGETSEPTGSLRIFNLQRGSASVLAEAVAEMLPKMRANPLRVVLPGGPDKPAKAPANLPGQGIASTKPVTAAARPVTLTAVGSRLIAVSDDPAALALVKELVELLTAPATGEGDFEVIRLRHANSAGIAVVLEELFNGRGSAGPGKSAARADRVRIVADPGSNSLLVKAAPLDLVMIRQLIRNTLDSDSADEQRQQLHVRLFPLKHVPAGDMAKMLRDIYRGMDRSLSLGVDARINSLVIRCSPVLEAEISTLIKELDVKGTPK